MILHAFLLLPDDKSDILEIVADRSAFDLLIDETGKALQILREKKGVKTYYDSKNQKSFWDACDEFDHGVYMDSAKSKIRSLLGHNSLDIRENPTTDNASYVLWNVDSATAKSPDMIAEIVERINKWFSFENTCLLLNMGTSVKACRDVILAFKDAKHIKSLPSAFARIQFVTNASELQIWLATEFVQKFSLSDENRFQRTGHVQQGEQVYKEIRTGRYWYLDNLHKNEYEIFDSNLRHLGTADLEGNFDAGGRVPGRKMD